MRIVGAYRLAGTDAVRSRFGNKGLYTATLFNYSDQFVDQIDPALELGRSFIRPEYHRSFGAAPLALESGRALRGRASAVEDSLRPGHYQQRLSIDFA